MKRESFFIVKKITVVMLLFTILLSGIRMPIQIKADVDTIGKLFKKPSTEYNNDLAYFAAELCDKAQGKSSNKVEQFLEKNGFNKKPYRYDESAAFVIGHKKVKIEGEGDATILVVVVRGSTTLAELIGAAAKESKVEKMLKKGKSIKDSLMAGKSWKKLVKEFDNAGKYRMLGQDVFHNIYDFEEKVWKELDKYLNDNPDIEKDKNLKILVTGHSLGGATANLIAARMDYLRDRGEWIDTAKKENIYCYTFGAIKVLTKNINIKDEYENIFNIYNKYDSFGPEGNMKFTNASHPKAKFGITLEYGTLIDAESGVSWNNHDMGGNYKKAVAKGIVKELVVGDEYLGGLLSYPSTKYNNDLAYFAAELCDKAQGSLSNKVEHYLREKGFTCKATNYNKVFNLGLISKSAAFVIGHKKVKIDGEGDAIVLVVIARGSTSAAEFIGDWLKGETKEFLEEQVYNNAYEFEETVWEGIQDYLKKNKEIAKADTLKILVTGHSLGGAAANMVAARMDSLVEDQEWTENVSKSDIHCYTFGAIKVLDQNSEEGYENIEDGYENIFNIYNKFDTFGPNGDNILKEFKASHPYAKFGCTLEYDKLHDAEIDSIKVWKNTCNNHSMGGNYKKAVEKRIVYDVAEEMGKALILDDMSDDDD